MKQTLATAGHQALAAASRLHAACGLTMAGYAWHADASIRPVSVTANPMDVFDTSKASRRRKEPSP